MKRAVDAAGAVDAKSTRPPRLGNRCAIPTSAHRPSLLDVYGTNRQRLTLAREHGSIDTHSPCRWPVFKRSSLAAFERSVTPTVLLLLRDGPESIGGVFNLAQSSLKAVACFETRNPRRPNTTFCDAVLRRAGPSQCSCRPPSRSAAAAEIPEVRRTPIRHHRRITRKALVVLVIRHGHSLPSLRLYSTIRPSPRCGRAGAVVGSPDGSRHPQIRLSRPTTLAPALDGRSVSRLPRAREWDSSGGGGTAHRGTTGGQKWQRQRERKS